MKQHLPRPALTLGPIVRLWRYSRRGLLRELCSFETLKRMVPHEFKVYSPKLIGGTLECFFSTTRSIREEAFINSAVLVC
jgi:hypothetical protein